MLMCLLVLGLFCWVLVLLWWTMWQMVLPKQQLLPLPWHGCCMLLLHKAGLELQQGG